MKCIILKNSGNIVRTTNRNAEFLVKKNLAEYTKKSEWRAFRKKFLSLEK